MTINERVSTADITAAMLRCTEQYVIEIVESIEHSLNRSLSDIEQQSVFCHVSAAVLRITDKMERAQ